MKVAIVGSRDWVDLSRVVTQVGTIAWEDPASVIVSGGAPGVDKTAEETAEELGLETLIFPADWDKYGKGAGFVRNKLIVEAADVVIAFWNGESKGTKNTIDEALRQKKDMLIFFPSLDDETDDQ